MTFAADYGRIRLDSRIGETHEYGNHIHNRDGIWFCDCVDRDRGMASAEYEKENCPSEDRLS